MSEQELREKFEEYCRKTFPCGQIGEISDFTIAFRGSWDVWQSCAESMKAEMDALMADAERYRWLRDKSFNGNGTSSSPQVNMSDDRGIIYGLELDCTIDQARGKP